MKVRLLHRDKDFNEKSPLPWQAEALTKDLELTTLFNAMAKGDEFLLHVVQEVVLAGFEKNPDTIRYRQDVLRDCMEHPAAVRELYALAVEATEAARKQYVGIFPERYPDSLLRHSIEHMETLVELIRRLRMFTDSHGGTFASAGLVGFFKRLTEELTDVYVAEIESHLNRLKFRGGISLSAELGSGNKGREYVLHQPPPCKRGTWLSLFLEWLEEFIPGLAHLFKPKTPAYGFSLHPRDESGARALAELRNRGIGPAANALAQSASHVRSFFHGLRAELAFYVGCLNLHEELSLKRVLVCIPVPMAMEERRLSFRGLCDVCLALHLDQPPVGNDVNADGRALVLITGANQGGKSTLLRAVGLAQLMMQCGMFVPAESFTASVCNALFTHYKREEDIGLTSGKLDEELSRMSDIVDRITPYSLILLNESFAATNEREGAEIARQIISALLERGISVVCVTHLYELARGFLDGNRRNTLFLRAERERTFKLVEGEPLQTSFGEDLYKSIFGAM